MTSRDKFNPEKTLEDGWELGTYKHDRHSPEFAAIRRTSDGLIFYLKPDSNNDFDTHSNSTMPGFEADVELRMLPADIKQALFDKDTALRSNPKKENWVSKVRGKAR